MNTQATSQDSVSGRVRIPADVERQDLVLAGLTARQVAILAAAGLTLWTCYQATKTLLPLTVFLTGAAVLAGAAFAVAVGTRDPPGTRYYGRSAVGPLGRVMDAPRTRVGQMSGTARDEAGAERQSSLSLQRVAVLAPRERKRVLSRALIGTWQPDSAIAASQGPVIPSGLPVLGASEH